MRQQGLGGHAAVDRTIRRRRLHNALRAGATAIAWPADYPNPQVGGDVIKHLGRVLADRMQLPAAAGTGLVLDIDHLLDPRQVRRQRTAIAFDRLGTRRACRAVLLWRDRRRRRRFQQRSLLRHRLLQILDPELHRRFAELLRAPAEAIALQCRDDQPLTLDLGQGRTQHLLQQDRVVGQVRWDCEHIPELNRRRESGPMNLS